MSEEEMKNKIKELEERNKILENMVNRGSSGNAKAYNEIRLMIIEKVDKEVEIDIISLKEKRWTRQIAEKKIMSDLKWDLRVRRIADFESKHVQLAKEYIEKYVLDEELKKSRWSK